MLRLNKYYLCIISISSVYLLASHPALADSEIDKKNKKEDVMDLGAVVVTWSENSDTAGYNEVYTKNMSSIYRGKSEIDRSKGLSPADILKGMPGVYSGDARNSGAIDVNIRGIQGQGRVPVTIDGTEQSMTVYRGYFGASNRNYLDPSLISSITVEKGGSLSTDVKTSVGGGVAMKTLGIDDVVDQGEKFGFDFTADTGTNTTKPRLPDLSPVGTDYRDDPTKMGGQMSIHPNLIKMPKSRSSSSDFFNLKDGSFRVAAGYRGEIFDLMGAISYRKQGNYFSGKKGANYYHQNAMGSSTANGAFVPDIASIYAPGSEVLNTSSTNRSFLLKNTWYLPYEQTLLLTARHSIIEHGELMPSRILWSKDGGIEQWPIGKINQRAYSMQYKWDPADNPWINTNVNLWKTITNSNTYTSGGFIFDLKTQDWMWNMCKNQNGGDVTNCKRDGKEHLYQNTAFTHARDNRWGITADNTMEIRDNLKFTAGIDYQKEYLESYTKTREGKRNSMALMFNFEWKPIPSVTINAGVKRNSYSSFDRRLSDARNRQDPIFTNNNVGAMEIKTKRAFTQNEYDFYQEISALENSDFNKYVEWMMANHEKNLEYTELKNAAFWGQKIEEKHRYSQREDGKYYAADNPYLNGTIDRSKVIDPFTGELVDNGAFDSSQSIYTGFAADKFAPVKKRKGHAWSPVASIGWEMTDNSRVYARYAEDQRFPSMFEDTIGFSTNVRDSVHLKPEKSRNIEFGYVYDLSWLPNTEASDIKISYYDMKLNNVIERDVNMFVSQVDEQRSKGIELQARYSNGKYFANIGLNYNLKNKTCDESSSMALDPTGNFPRCVDGGFPIGFLRTQTVPKYSLNLELGGKFLNDDLLVTTNFNYHSKARNGQEAQMVKDGLLVNNSMNNNPIRWNSVLLVDASLSYKVDKNFTLTFSGHNLTNQYYIDPLTRSFMPAPGRTFRVGFTGHF